MREVLERTLGQGVMKMRKRFRSKIGVKFEKLRKVIPNACEILLRSLKVKLKFDEHKNIE